MMKQKRERERREKAKRESKWTYEDVEWGNSSIIKDLLRKQRVSVLNLYIERHNQTTEKKLTKKKKRKEKKKKLD